MGALALIGALTTQGCLFDLAPIREPLDRLWNEHMLAAQYGDWVDGEKRSRRLEAEDRIKSSPVSAFYTKYGIGVGRSSPLGGGSWDLVGGLIGRIERHQATVELFAKEVARVHGPAHTVQAGRDFGYEFFLVVRPVSTRRGRVVRQWNFPSEEVALVFDPVHRERLRQANRTETEIDHILEKTPGVQRGEYVDGYLAFDASRNIAVVTITGLKRPFEERVDLSGELPP